ncbi:hypothetical protein ACFVZH_36600 [Streptomyces sp. NPDC059534]|uniref:hypothetical protein n=1 Tax=Streptomyces sp. NPDC059534 TaxID=3346859 RepID=UPI00368DEEB7
MTALSPDEKQYRLHLAALATARMEGIDKPTEDNLAAFAIYMNGAREAGITDAEIAAKAKTLRNS